MLFKKTQLLVFLFTIIFSSFTFSQTTCNDTSWDKAVDFDGANQHLKQVSQNTGVNAIRMAGQSQTVALGSNVGYTTNVGAGRPWATTIMFKTDRNGSNQHIWNSGEGAGSTDDNIYLRLDANGWVYFGWGRGSSNNECRFLGIPHSSTGRWWGVYIAHKGARFNSSNATAANLADAFDIRVITNNGGDEFNTLGANQSTSANWITTGNRMDRSVTGDFTIGGRGSNRSFHGQVASMVVTTLKLNDPMPNDAEIKAMITDPMGWLNDYKIGNIYGDYSSGGNLTNFQLNTLDAAYATQVWLMGDGTSDSYSNGIRNEVNPTEQNYGKLQLDNNMQNSIQSVNISGFSEAACRATSAVFGTETTSTLNLESFTAPSGGADGYAIYINDSNSFTAPSNGDEPTADLSWNDSGQQPVYFGTSASPDITVTDLDPGTTYYFQVYAYNDSSGTETYETTGLNASDATTADTSPPSAPTVGPASATTVTGTAEAGSTVTVTDSDGDVIGTATADSDGNYSVTLSSAQSNGSTLSVTATDASGNESEATTTRVVIGITYEGPSSNQTGTNITDNGDYGWISIDETLEAGQRFVMDNAFFEDLLGEMPSAYEIRIGLKGDNWDNGDQSTKTNSVVSGEVFKGDFQLRISGSPQSKTLQLFRTGTSYNTMLNNTPALQNITCGFIEVTPDGNNIRFGFGRNGSYSISQGDESTKTYDDWGGYKGETGDQGYGISSLDVVFLVTDVFNEQSADYDGANIDWTELTEVSSDPTDGLAPIAPAVSTASGSTVIGTAEFGSTVTVTDSNGDVIGTATADSDGNYSVTLSPAQSDGSTLTVTATDASGNESEETTTYIPISGFTHIAASASMAGTDVLDDGSAVSIDDTLSDGQRIVFSADWIKTNVWDNIPSENVSGSGDAIYIGILKTGHNLNSISDDDFAFAYKFWNDSGTSDFKVVTGGGNSTEVQGTWNRDVVFFHDYSVTGHFHGLSNAAAGTGATIAVPTVYSYYSTQPTSEDVTIVIASTGPQASISTTGISEVNASAPDAPIVSTASADTVTGTAEAGSTVTVSDSDGDVIGTATTDSSGNYSVTLSPAQSDGSTLTVTATDATGNESEETTTTVDASAPDAPIVSTASADTVTGTAEAGSTVTVTDSNGDVIGTATADSSGNYSVTLSPEQSNGSTLAVTATDASGNESDQTTTTIVLGITLVGPSDNQTGTNLFDAGDHGWATLDESLSAGERLTLTNAFLSSLVDAMPDNSYIIIGLKSSTWSSTITDDDILDNNYNGFKGKAYLKIDKYDSSNSGIVRMSLGANGTNSSFVDVGSGGAINSGYNAFIEISADGNNIRLGQGLLTANGGDDPATTPYCDWSDISSTNKAQTGDQDFGITSLDVVIGGGGNSSDSIKTHGGMNTVPVEWIIMSQVGVPSTPCSAPTSQATSAVFGTETSTSLNLESFTAPAGGAVGYAIYINDSNSFTAPLNGVEPTEDLSWNGSGQQPVYFGTSASPNITVTDLDPGTTYYFQVYAYNNSSGTEIYETTGLNASDVTAAQVVPGITLEGPNANQSGTNLSDVDDWGWASLNNPLGAGERVVFNNDFMLDIFSSMPDNYDLRIGLKDDSWDNSEGNGRDGFLGGTFLLIKRESVDYGSISLWANGLPSFTSVTLSSIISDTDKFSAFIELDALGDKINIGLNSTDFSDELNVYSTAYCNWAEDAKATTNNSVGYNISTVDIMIRGAATVDNLAGFDTADVDWSGITQVAVPSPAPTAQATSAVFGTETSTSLKLESFTAPAGGADGYVIYVNDTNSFTAPTDGDEPTADLSWNGSGQQPVYFGTSVSPNITVTDLNPGTTYYYKVYAYKNCLESETYEAIGLNATDTTAIGVLTITGITGNNKVYDDTTAATASGTATLVGVASGDDISLGGSPVFTFSSANVGTGITINTTGYTLSGTDAAKYTLTQPTLSGDITAADLTVTASDQTKVYGATDPTLTYSITGFQGTDTEADLDTAVSISRAVGEDVGTYTITPSAAADSNYTVSFVTADFTITAADLTVTASDQTKVYGATDPTLTYSITGFQGTDTEADLDTAVSISRAVGEDVGTYTITPSAAADSNYTVSFVTADFTITAADLTVTAIDQTKVYGATDPTLTYSITGFQGTDTEADLDTGVSISRAVGEDVGTYTITPSAAADSNYTVSFVTADFTITAADLTVTASDQTKVYGATDPTLTYSITGFQGTDTEADLDTAVSISRAVGEDVGTYTITPSAAADSNYTVSFVTADFTITAADLTVTAIDQTKVYGATDPTLTYSITGFQGTDTEADLDTAVSISRAVGEDVGTYTITPSAAADSNYTVSFVTADFTITAADLTVTASDQTKVYGATDPTLTYSITGFQGTDTEADLDTAVSISRAVGEDVGTYTITPSAAADSNYTVSFVTADFTITAADLTVTAIDQTKVYGATDPTLTYSITGFQGTDTEADLDTAVSISRAVGEDVGTYTITPSAAADSNYTVSFVTADFTITAAALTVTASDQTKVYGATDPTLTYSITGFQGTDTEADLDTGVSISRAVGEDVGTYTITPSAAADSNYTVSFVTADFTITAADLTVTASDQTKVYGATDPTLTYSITGFQGTDTEADLDTGVSISRAVGEDVGTYTITPSAAADSNYTVSFVTADFTITAADLTVTASDQTKVYGATDPTLTYSITGFQGTDTEADLDTAVSISRAVGEDVGTYTITPSAAADSNYTVSFVTADFTITAADLTVTASDQTKVYGATDPSLSYTITGFVNGEDESDLDTAVSISRAVGEDVGTYTITPSAADSNYTISFVTADFTITQATLTITGLVGKNKVYDETTVATSIGIAALAGVVSNDDVSLGGSPVFTFEVPDPGIFIMITTTGYTITGSDSGNYILIQPTLYADITDPDEDCDGDGIIDTEDTDFSSCALAIRNTTRYGFSPNEDGINDVWFIENIFAYPNNTVKVFNRSGKLVFKQRGYQNDWNGESNQVSSGRSGNKLPTGPYIFMLDLGEGNELIKGWLYINY